MCLTTLPDNKEQEKTNLSAPRTNTVVREYKKCTVVRVGTPERLGEGHVKGTQFLVRLQGSDLHEKTAFRQRLKVSGGTTYREKVPAEKKVLKKMVLKVLKPGGLS